MRLMPLTMDWKMYRQQELKLMISKGRTCCSFPSCMTGIHRPIIHKGVVGGTDDEMDKMLLSHRRSVWMYERKADQATKSRIFNLRKRIHYLKPLNLDSQIM